jgi:O-antigen ligase
VTKRQLTAVLLLALMTALAVGEPALWRALGPVLAVASILLSRPFKLRLDLASGAVLLFAAYACLSWFWSVTPWVSFISAISYVSVAIAFIAIRHVVTDVTALRMVAFGYLAGCIYLVVRLLSLSVAVAGEPIGGRLNLPGINANYAGYALAAGFAVILLLLVTAPSSVIRKTMYAIMALALVVGILLAGARASLVALVAICLWVAATYLIGRPPLRALLAVVAAAFVVVISGVADKGLFIFDDTADRSTGGLSGRLDLWPLARAWWSDHFVVGTGTSSFQGSNPFYAGAHNLILELGTGLGIVGVVGFVAMLWFALRGGDRFLVGGFIAVSAASYLTGHWEAAPAAWVGIALFSMTGFGEVRIPTRVAGIPRKRSVAGPGRASGARERVT